MSPEEKQGAFAPPDTKSWLEYSWKIQQDVPNRFEDAAKFLVTILSIVMTLFAANLQNLKLLTSCNILFGFMFLFWFAALIFAFMVLFPHRYTFPSKSVERIKEMNNNVIKKKKLYFYLSMFFFIIPFFAFMVLIFLVTLK